jgi:hypothetical protein
MNVADQFLGRGLRGGGVVGGIFGDGGGDGGFVVEAVEVAAGGFEFRDPFLGLSSVSIEYEKGGHVLVLVFGMEEGLA